MANYADRLERLEAVMAPCVAPPTYRHRVITQVGETEEQAVAAYAAAQGVPVVEVEQSVIYRVLVEPPTWP